MAIKPILHRILVKPDDLHAKDQAFAAARRMGLEIVEAERKREQAAIDTGTVVEVGPTAFKDFGVSTPPVGVGTVVVYAKYGGKAIVDPATRESFVALNDEDIIAIISE